MTSKRNVLQDRSQASDAHARRRSGETAIDASRHVSGSADKSRLAAIVESSNDAIISYTQKGIIDSWNRGAERLYGYSAAEAIGKSVTMILPSHHAGEEAKIPQKVRRGEGMDHNLLGLNNVKITTAVGPNMEALSALQSKNAEP